MADGWLRELRGDASVGVASAGIVGGTAVKPGAITVAARVGSHRVDAAQTPRLCYGDAASAGWIFRGGGIAATPRVLGGYSVGA